MARNFRQILRHVCLLTATALLLLFAKPGQADQILYLQSDREALQVRLDEELAPETHERRVSADATRVSLTLPDRVRDKLRRLKDLWAHANPEMDYVELIERAADIALAKKDPVRRKVRKTQGATESAVKNEPSTRPTHYRVEFDRVLWTRAGSQDLVADRAGVQVKLSRLFWFSNFLLDYFNHDLAA